jgi:hypothetical protein
MATLLLKSIKPYDLPSSLNLNPPPSPSPLLALVSLPYIQGIIDHISMLLAKTNIKTLFKPHKTLKQLFRSELRTNMIPCLAKEFSIFSLPLANHTLEKQEDPSKPALRKISLTLTTITSLSQKSQNTLTTLSTSSALEKPIFLPLPTSTHLVSFRNCPKSKNSQTISIVKMATNLANHGNLLFITFFTSGFWPV